MTIIAACLLLAGCAKIQPGKGPAKYQTVAATGRHDTKTAERIHQQAVECLQPGSMDKAEALLNEALVADSTYGPAHNSLGTVYFNQGKLYLAAWEFEYAIKLMPDLAQPYNNLGLVYEKAGKYEDALSYYSMASSHDSGSSEIMGNIVRVRMLMGDRSPDLKDALSDLALNHTNRQWQCWARDQVELTKFDDSTTRLFDESIGSEQILEPKTPSLEELPAPVPQPVLESPAPAVMYFNDSGIQKAPQARPHPKPVVKSTVLQPIDVP